MAMYPFNKLSQFGKVIEVKDSTGQTHRCGGIITFSASDPPEPKSFKQLDKVPYDLVFPPDFYNVEEHAGHLDELSDDFNVSNWKWYMLLVLICILLFLYLSNK